jgi:hypothetical protein
MTPAPTTPARYTLRHERLADGAKCYVVQRAVTDVAVMRGRHEAAKAARVLNGGRPPRR